VSGGATPPRAVVLDLATTVQIDIQTADTIAELASQLGRDGVELRLANVYAPARDVLDRAGVTRAVSVAESLDAALAGASPARAAAATPHHPRG
jgi:anti-anti-sigma regulatory factor